MTSMMLESNDSSPLSSTNSCWLIARPSMNRSMNFKIISIIFNQKETNSPMITKSHVSLVNSLYPDQTLLEGPPLQVRGLNSDPSF